jgi:hypothetical protein
VTGSKDPGTTAILLMHSPYPLHVTDS